MKHGYAKRKTPRSNIYRRWQHMIQRCHNPKDRDYTRYGARGIEVCSRWRLGDSALSGFECFLFDMGVPECQSLTLDRIDVHGHYAPCNVRWATPKQQANNRTNTKMLTIRGETKPLSAWCEQFGIGPKLVLYRLKSGLSVEQSITNPVSKYRKKEQHHG